MDYRLLIDIEVFDVLRSLQSRRQQRLLEHFRRIQRHPEDHAEYSERDPSGRRIDVCLFEGYAIYYWEDFADRQVKILELLPADE